MAPIVHGLEVEYYNRVEFTYLNIDDPKTTPFKKELEYKYQPHFFLLDGEGEVIQQWLGPKTKGEMRSILDAALEG